MLRVARGARGARALLKFRQHHSELLAARVTRRGLCTAGDNKDKDNNSSKAEGKAEGATPKPEKEDPDALRRRLNKLLHIKRPPPGFFNFWRGPFDEPVDTEQEQQQREQGDDQAQQQQQQQKQDQTPAGFLADLQRALTNMLRGNTSGGTAGDKGGEASGGHKLFLRFVQGSVVALIVANVGGVLLGRPNEGQEVSWKELLELIERGQVGQLEVVNLQRVRVHLKDSTPTSLRAYMTIGSADSFERSLDEMQQYLGLEPNEFVPVVYRNERDWMVEALKFLPTVAIVAFWIYMSRRVGGGMGGGGMGGGGMFGFGRMNNKLVSKEMLVKTNFDNVAGLDEAKTEVVEFVEFLKNPKRFVEIGAKIPKGALLVGPPGTGKTLLAKAVAGEAKVPFLSVSGSDFVEMFVGVGPSRVRDLFAQARETTPCIVFIDEIDAIGRKRGGGRMRGNDERENTLNQMLVEMDGFSSSAGVVVLAATNRAELLDDALLRPGRFDRRISVDAPDLKGRKQIFEVHLKGLKLDADVEEVAKRMAARVPGFVGADIANVCNEAALIAARHEKNAVGMDDFEAAIDRVIAGIEKKNRVLSDEERRVVAFHEAGHAVCGWFLEHASPLVKVTIVPRGSGALGYAQYQPRDQYIYTQAQLLDTMCMTLGGRASEQVFFGRVTTGAQDDLQKVTEMAYSQVTQFGMNTTVGIVSFPRSQGSDLSRPYSQATASLIDEEVRKMVSAAYERTVALISERKEEISKVANQLLKEDKLMHEDMVSLLGKRPFKQVMGFDEIVEDAHQSETPSIYQPKAASAKQDAAEQGAPVA